MIKEISWYLESGRFTGIVEELEGSLRKYEEAKRENAEEETQNTLREEARQLFEEHCVSSGLREADKPFINIDAEFFTESALDEKAMNTFLKKIVKGHCYQKVLWTYMGTTGSYTQISKSEMINQGLRYEDYLPIEYKRNLKEKKPLTGRVDENTELFYIYGDGSISNKYNPEKAKLRFDRLEDKSGIDWRKGYDPNGSVEKNGWHGKYAKDGTWVRVEGEKRGFTEAYGNKVSNIELIRNGESVILYDPGMMLLSPAMILYMTENGEPYGNLGIDTAGTAAEIKRALEKMGVERIDTIGGIDNPELVPAYQSALKELLCAKIKVMGNKEVLAVKAAQRKEAVEIAAEKTGTLLSKKLNNAIVSGAAGKSILETVSKGSVTVPLSPRKQEDGHALGLEESEIKEINGIPLKREKERIFDTVLSNLYASWAMYSGSFESKVDAAVMVGEYLERGNKPETLTAQTSLEEIIKGKEETARDKIKMYASGIPGLFSEVESVDFYDSEAREKYIAKLEKKKILPKGGAVTTLASLQALPEGTKEQKAVLNKGLTRALSQYKAVSMSTGMPIAELIEAVKAAAGLSGKPNQQVMGRKIYYELGMEDLVKEAGKENSQSKEITLDSVKDSGNETIIIGGVSGRALDEVEFSYEKLVSDYGYSAEEAAIAQPFLHNVRFTGDNAIVPAFLLEAVKQSKDKTASGLRRNVLTAVEANNAGVYNLSTEEGLNAYVESKSARENKIGRKEVEELLLEEKQSYSGNNFSNNVLTTSKVTRIEPRYKTQGTVVPLTRSVPRGSPEKILLAKQFNDIGGETIEPAAVNFYEKTSREKYIRTLEKELILTGNEAAVMLSALRTLPQGSEEQKAELNQGLSRALSQYKEIKMKTDMPVEELLEAVKASAGFEGEKTVMIGGETIEPATVNFYEKTSREKYIRRLEKELILTGNEAAVMLSALRTLPQGSEEQKAELNQGLSRALSQYKEIRMKADMPVEELLEAVKASAGFEGEKTVMIGGESGKALGDAAFTREKLINEYGYSAEEAQEAQGFLRSVRFTGEDVAIPAYIYEAVRQDKGKTSAGLTRNILKVLETKGSAAYKLSTKEGLQAYVESKTGRDRKEKPRREKSLEPEVKSSDAVIPIDRNRNVEVSRENIISAAGLQVGDRNTDNIVEPQVYEDPGVQHSYTPSLSETLISSLMDTREKPGYRGQADIATVSRNKPGGSSEQIRQKNKPRMGQGTVRVSDDITGAYKHQDTVDTAIPFESINLTGQASLSSQLSSTMFDSSNESLETEAKNYNPLMSFPKHHSRDTELERLRKIESNYERDKAMISKRKQPALARSETHDVGHAGGIVRTDPSERKRASKKLQSGFAKELKGEI